MTDEMLTVSADEDVVEDELSHVMGDDEPETMPFWQRWLGHLQPTEEQRQDDQEQRLYDLDVAIESYPETPGNYVLRGEIYLEQGKLDQAIADFESGLVYASTQVEHDDWGFISQFMQDRAEAGLEEAQQRLNRRRDKMAASGVFD